MALLNTNIWRNSSTSWPLESLTYLKRSPYLTLSALNQNYLRWPFGATFTQHSNILNSFLARQRQDKPEYCHSFDLSWTIRAFHLLMTKIKDSSAGNGTAIICISVNLDGSACSFSMQITTSSFPLPNSLCSSKCSQTWQNILHSQQGWSINSSKVSHLSVKVELTTTWSTVVTDCCARAGFH